ncbi:hypothetical protein ACP70R_039436 [Stipagrostis hirtigluma subsp. patula]
MIYFSQAELDEYQESLKNYPEHLKKLADNVPGYYVRPDGAMVCLL